jgi:phage major head subunit gpT-like protein
MVHKITKADGFDLEEFEPTEWIVWSGNMISEEAGWTPEQIAKMVKEGTISFEHYKPDLIKITDAKDEKVFVKEEFK